MSCWRHLVIPSLDRVTVVQLATFTSSDFPAAVPVAQRWPSVVQCHRQQTHRSSKPLLSITGSGVGTHSYLLTLRRNSMGTKNAPSSEDGSAQCNQSLPLAKNWVGRKTLHLFVQSPLCEPSESGSCPQGRHVSPFHGSERCWRSLDLGLAPKAIC